jgi:1-deoxy-D-xylulose-5-phosphate synthase
MSQKLLDHIDLPSHLRKLKADELPILADELRRFIIDIVAVKQGHLGASLGVVELTIALHYIFDTPNDRLIWDVGHQAYGHKILTGRKTQFHTNRELGGISGFPKMDESPYDCFGTGHSSTSISAALGMALAAQLEGNTKRQHIAVIGDASVASGMAFEALNHAGVTNANLLVILNDNAIGIDPSVGALKEYLMQANVKAAPESDNIFEALNFAYSGPIDGHDLPTLLSTLSELKKATGPRLLHVITTKGKGLQKAEQEQVTYHAPGRFDATTGELIKKEEGHLPPKYQDVFGHTLVELAETNPKIVGITPAMPTGSSMKYLMERFPERAFDVGIAEQHAVTLAAGMATQGYRVYCAIYSTFLQRAYDQVIHDVCLQKLPVVFCLDRAGIVGADGATHHGIFDLAYLRCIPNLLIYAPRGLVELRNILYTAQDGMQLPIAIRYPRGRGEVTHWQRPFEKIRLGRGQLLKDGKDLAVISVGSMAQTVTTAIAEIGDGSVAHYDLGFVKPLDREMLRAIFNRFETIVTVEDGVIAGGAGSAIAEFAAENNFKNRLVLMGIPDRFPQHGTTDELFDEAGLSPEKIAKKLQSLL